MSKRFSDKIRKWLNEVSGYIVMIFGGSLIFNFIFNINSEMNLLTSFSGLIFGVGLILLGIYVLRSEKWARILSAIYAITLLISTYLVSKLYGGALLLLLVNIPCYVIIMNWWLFDDK